MIPTILTGRLAGRITPAEAAEVAMAAHRLLHARVRQVADAPVAEIYCSCGLTILDGNEDEAFARFCEHGLVAIDGFTAQLVDPRWLDKMLVAQAALTHDGGAIDGLDRQLADYAALGDAR